MQGISATDALRVILGDETEESQPRPSMEEFVESIRNADGPPWNYEEGGYDACTRWLARQILEWLLENPNRANLPVEDIIEWPKLHDGSIDYHKMPILVAAGWSRRMKEDGRFPDGMYGCSGFQWGWAVNAARKCVELPAVANPALLVVDIEVPSYVGPEAEKGSETLEIPSDILKTQEISDLDGVA
jgi:hypothetical protein